MWSHRRDKVRSANRSGFKGVGQLIAYHSGAIVIWTQHGSVSVVAIHHSYSLFCSLL